MDYELIITVRASQEVEEAIDYYDRIDPKLGTRFLTELSETYKKLSVNPQFYSYVLSSRKSNIRDTKLKSFPYLIIFEIREGIVMVISVSNMYKKPFSL